MCTFNIIKPNDYSFNSVSYIILIQNSLETNMIYYLMNMIYYYYDL